MLEENFSRLGDLAGQNEAHYQKEVHRAPQLTQWAYLEKTAWGTLAGYGVRPLRVLTMLAGASAAFLLVNLGPM